MYVEWYVLNKKSHDQQLSAELVFFEIYDNALNLDYVEWFYVSYWKFQDNFQI